LAHYTVIVELSTLHWVKERRYVIRLSRTAESGELGSGQRPMGVGSGSATSSASERTASEASFWLN
jgi:hypothetical protein